MKTESTRRWQWVALALILVLALGLRFYRLDAQSFWNDEGTSIALAQRDFGTITRNAAHDIHPPLYYYLLHLWVSLFGPSELAARSLSALAGVGMVVGTFVLGRRLFSGITGLLAALLAAIAPFQVYYSQETRMYALATLFGLMSMLIYQRLLAQYARDRLSEARGWAVLYIISGVLAIYTHYYALSLLLAQNLGMLAWWVIRRRRGRAAWLSTARRLGHWGLTQALILLCYVPWLVISWDSLTGWPAVSPPLSLSEFLGEAARVLLLGVTVDSSRLSLAAGLVVATLALVGLILAGHSQDRLRESFGRLYAGLYLLVPPATMYLLSLQRPIYKFKFLLLSAPAYTLLLARGILGLGELGRRRMGRRARDWIVLLGALAVCAASGWSLYNLYVEPRFYRDDYRGIVEYIASASGPGDALLVNAPSQIETIDYYYDGSLPWYALPRQRPIDVADAERQLQQIVAQHDHLYSIFWATSESDPQGFVEGWLDDHCFKAMNSWFGDVRLVVYAVPKQAPEGFAQSTDYLLGDLIRLRGYTLLTPQPRSGEIVQLILVWEAVVPIERRYKVFVHVVDSRGNIVGQRDSEPGDGRRLTSGWQPGESVVDNYGILVQAATPPGSHLLRVGLYDLETGQRLGAWLDGRTLGDAIDVAPLDIERASAPPPLAALDAQIRDEHTWGDLQLVGHTMQSRGADPQRELLVGRGGVLQLTLFWRRVADGDSSNQVVVSLSKHGDLVWERSLAATGGAYPLDEWSVGEIVRDVQPLFLPQELDRGTYQLGLRLAGEEWQRAYALGRVRVD